MKPNYNTPHYEVEHIMRNVDKEYNLVPLPDWICAKVIYPYGMAVARVVFYERSNTNNWVSTYLDAIDQLGYVGAPYFELYPNEDGDTERFRMHEEPDLYRRVIEILSRKRSA